MLSSSIAVFGLVLPALMLAAAVRDVTSFTIPNWIPLGLALAFPGIALASGFTPSVMAGHALTGGLALLIGMGLFALGGIGGGDAKLLAATALWLGWPVTATFLFYTALAGGLLAGALMALRSAPARSRVGRSPAWLARLAQPGEGVPYGVAITAGALFAFPRTPFAAGLGL